MDITPYLKLLAEKKGSDLFFSSGATVRIKIEGESKPIGKTILNGESSKAAAYGIMTKEQIR